MTNVYKLLTSSLKINDNVNFCFYKEVCYIFSILCIDCLQALIIMFTLISIIFAIIAAMNSSYK